MSISALLLPCCCYMCMLKYVLLVSEKCYMMRIRKEFVFQMEFNSVSEFYEV
jgi:hypothetical protein